MTGRMTGGMGGRRPAEPVHPDWERAGADWPNRAASHFLRAGGVSWHYQRMGQNAEMGEAGSGTARPAALLLHGAAAATHTWRDLQPRLAQRFDTLAPDLPQHGFSRARGGGRQSLPGMARAVATLIAETGMQPDIVVGHSAGTAIGLRMALDGLIAPRAIIGINAALTPFRGVAGFLFPTTAKLLALNPLTPFIVSSLTRGPAQTRRLIEATGSRIDARGLAAYARLFSRAEHVSGVLLMMANWDLTPLLRDLPALQPPLHLIVAEDDRAVPPGEARTLAAGHRGIHLHSFPAGGHLLHETRADDIAVLVEEIADGVAG